MTIQEKACEMISRIPEDSTFEDIQYHLYVPKCIERGKQDVRDGKMLPHEQAKERLAKWLK